MKLQGYLMVIVVVGLTLECFGSPFTFPENDYGGRSLSQQDYGDYDSRIHHHNGHHQGGHHHGGHQHGGHNKRKKLKKKRKKRPCYYKTSDGRTFFWTGVNIYETNIYVNQGNKPFGDVGNLGASPCGSENDNGETDNGTQDSPLGSFQSPQRPNRPILQNLATYIPSGPATWNWFQGVQWSNYLPNQNSINSAVNTVVDYLPGFGSYRPRPPSIPVRPVRPVTEFPFTRPTEFTRPPTFTRPTQQPVYTRPTQQPVYTRPTQQPVYTRPTQQPVYTRPTQQPIYTRPTQQPTRPTFQPVFTRPSSTMPPTSTGEDGSDENYDYSNFSSESSDNSADTAINGLGSSTQQSSNQPASNIPTLGSIGNGIKPVYERPGKYFNDYIVKPFRGSIREVVRWFR